VRFGIGHQNIDFLHGCEVMAQELVIDPGPLVLAHELFHLRVYWGIEGDRKRSDTPGVQDRLQAVWLVLCSFRKRISSIYFYKDIKD
jgi:hypothetical protein